MEPPGGLTHTPRQRKRLCLPFSLITRASWLQEPWMWLVSVAPSAPLLSWDPEQLFRLKHRKRLCKADGFQPKDQIIEIQNLLFYPVSKSELWLFCMPLLPHKITHLQPWRQFQEYPRTVSAASFTINFHGCSNDQCQLDGSGLSAVLPVSLLSLRGFLIKVNIVLRLIKVNTCFPKSHIISRCFATFFPSFTTNTTTRLLKSTEHRGQKYGSRSGHAKHGGCGMMPSPYVFFNHSCTMAIKPCTLELKTVFTSITTFESHSPLHRWEDSASDFPTVQWPASGEARLKPTARPPASLPFWAAELP